MDSLYSKLKKQVSGKINEGLQLIKRSSSAASGHLNDLSWDGGTPHHFEQTGGLKFDRSQTSLKSQTANNSFTKSDSILDFGNGPPAIHDGPGNGGQRQQFQLSNNLQAFTHQQINLNTNYNPKR